jgi:hypothetical protein
MGSKIQNAFRGRPPASLKRAADIVRWSGFLCSPVSGEVVGFIDSPHDDLNVSEWSKFQPLAAEYKELIAVRIKPLKLADVTAIFGPKLSQPPEDRTLPWLAPRWYTGSAVACDDPASKRHVDFLASGNIGSLEIHHQFDGVTPGPCMCYLRMDDQFVPLKVYDNVPQRLAWDQAKFAKLEEWLAAQLPPLTNLGVVEVSTAKPTRIDLGAGAACMVTTRDIHMASVPDWISFVLAKDTLNPAEKENSLQHKSVDRPGQSFGFSMDGKFYRLTPKLLTPPQGTNQ